MTHGTVKYINVKEGYGFITVDEVGPYAFFRYQTAQGTVFETISEDQEVEFEIAQGPLGPCPKDVRPLGCPVRTLH
ncbi:MAG: cspA [Pseudomonas sp.]|nr:cspA [Pseudomonas sp.]